jgi:hypothetical protein
MDNENRILSLSEKVRLVARDIYNTAILNHSLKLEYFLPSKQLQSLLDEQEYDRLITHLRERRILLSLYPVLPTTITLINAPNNRFQAYEMKISEPNIRRLLGLKDITSKPVEKGVKLHSRLSVLIVNGAEVPLAKGELHRSLQYWICRLCLKKPNTPVKETDIMAKYATDYEVTARSRAVRDAVYKLNPKIKHAAKIDGLFTYSSGYVTFNADKLK